MKLSQTKTPSKWASSASKSMLQDLLNQQKAPKLTNHNCCKLSIQMATLYRTLSRPTINLIKTSLPKPSSATSASFSRAASQPSSIFSRPLCQMAALQSMLPLHSAVSSARLTCCLGIDSKGSRSLSQGMLCSANPGV
ncbi:hypothetical protein Leryth_021352 [Lithospermum erythrorhizon]|nr:hypothetical protein Leryth_021352 [Lithospermum erythrorhizon]